MNSKQVIDIFIEHGIVQRDQVDDILQEISVTGKSIMQVLVDYDFMTEEQFYHVLAESLGTEFVDLKNFEPPQELLRMLPAGLARLHGALPVAANDDMISVALIDPLDSRSRKTSGLPSGRRSTS